MQKFWNNNAIPLVALIIGLTTGTFADRLLVERNTARALEAIEELSKRVSTLEVRDREAVSRHEWGLLLRKMEVLEVKLDRIAERGR